MFKKGMRKKNIKCRLALPDTETYYRIIGINMHGTGIGIEKNNSLTQ